MEYIKELILDIEKIEKYLSDLKSGIIPAPNEYFQDVAGQEWLLQDFKDKLVDYIRYEFIKQE